MNGNANLNANNLTAQNVQDWRNKLGIGGGGTVTDVQVDNNSVVQSDVAHLNTINSNYNASTNKLATKSELDQKVNKSSTANQLYGTNSSGNQATLIYGTASTSGYIVQRKSGGQISVPAIPSADTDAASKYYVDTEHRTELLYIAVTAANTDYALNDSIANYKWLVIRFRVAGSEYAWGVIPCSMILEQNSTYSNIVSTDSRWLSFYILRDTPSTIHIVGTGHNSTANGKNNLWVCGIK